MQTIKRESKKGKFNFSPTCLHFDALFQPQYLTVSRFFVSTEAPDCYYYLRISRNFKCLAIIISKLTITRQITELEVVIAHTFPEFSIVKPCLTTAGPPILLCTFEIDRVLSTVSAPCERNCEGSPRRHSLFLRFGCSRRGRMLSHHLLSMTQIAIGIIVNHCGVVVPHIHKTSNVHFIIIMTNSNRNSNSSTPARAGQLLRLPDGRCRRRNHHHAVLGDPETELEDLVRLLSITIPQHCRRRKNNRNLIHLSLLKAQEIVNKHDAILLSSLSSQQLQKQQQQGHQDSLCSYYGDDLEDVALILNDFLVFGNNADASQLSPEIVAQVHTSMGWIRDYQGNYSSASVSLLKALWIQLRRRTQEQVVAHNTHTGHNDSIVLGQACHRLALVYGKAGNYARGQALLERALEYYHDNDATASSSHGILQSRVLRRRYHRQQYHAKKSLVQAVRTTLMDYQQHVAVATPLHKTKSLSSPRPSDATTVRLSTISEVGYPLLDLVGVGALASAAAP